MVREWDGPSDEGIAAFNKGDALGKRLQRIAALRSGDEIPDWFPNVDEFDGCRTSLEIKNFDREKGLGVLNDLVETLVALRLVTDRHAVKLARYETYGWILSLPVKNIDEVELDRQAPPDGRPPAARQAPLKLKL